jgi:hypothetical protein
MIHYLTIGLVFLHVLKCSNSFSTSSLRSPALLQKKKKKKHPLQFHGSPLFLTNSIRLNPFFPSQRQQHNRILNFESKTMNTIHPLNVAAEPNPSEEKSSSLRDRLLKISNAASLLCVIDCTVLPIVTILLPLLGLGVAASYATLNAKLHHIGHQMALYFVLPVGGFAMMMNYLKHAKKRLLLLSSLGMGLVYLANAGHNSPILALFPSQIAHDLHCGTILHRLVNILGCACLLSSNYLAKKISPAGCGGLGHHHDHSHEHQNCCETKDDDEL